MALQFRCKNEKRSGVLRDSTVSLNGIDYLEVLHEDAPAGTVPQRTLLVRMLKAEPWGLSEANVRIEGGVRVTGIDVVWALRASEVSNVLVSQGQITEAEKDFFLALPEPDHVLVVRTNTEGDFSPYTLHLVKSSTDSSPPPGLDPILSEVEFSFKVDCPSEFDCRADFECPPQAAQEPLIDYLAKDYASFRRLMLDRLGVVMPYWKERSPADLGITIVELLAYAGDTLSYYQDAAATEAYLGTARRRISMRRHARLLDYPMHDGCNARTWVHVEVDVDSISLKQGTQLLTRVSGQPKRIATDSTAYGQALAQQPVVFETMHNTVFYLTHNQVEFYTWGDPECCLPKGATGATLKGDLPYLMPGDVLVFEEARGVESGRKADADPMRRHAVRLTKAAPAEDPFGGQFLDPPTSNPVAVTEIEWMAQDALPFPLCVWTVEVPEDDRGAGELEAQPVAIVLGNMVLADHGRTIEGEGLGTVPATGPYRPRLQRIEVTHRVADDQDEDGSLSLDRSATELLGQDPRRALPYLVLEDGDEPWLPQCDLLASDRFAAEFVVEMESDGRATLRFGDGIYGRQPTGGTEFTAAYRIGNGQAGNIGAEALYHVVAGDSGIVSVRNPLPARGGTDPESIEEVRLYAPQAFRTQERAVTEADYAEVAQRHPEVQKAAATRRWTGSWYTMFLTVDREGGLPVDSVFEAELRDFLERYRLAGQDLEIDGPSFIPMDMVFVICAEPDYLRANIKEALLETFSSRDLPDGRRGFFHPDNFTFGQPVYLSKIVAEIMQVPGVRWVDLDASRGTRFQRWGQVARGELESGQIDIGRLEIARLDNDPNAPENGRLDFIMEGGL